jgi:hypothetical protein
MLRRQSPGTVVGDSLRRTLSERGAKATGNLESMNQIALDTTCTSGRSICRSRYGSPAPRNDADHGMWEKVSNPKKMLSRHEVNIAEPDRTDSKRDCIASKLSLWR